jgi:hypothetical protein
VQRREREVRLGLDTAGLQGPRRAGRRVRQQSGLADAGLAAQHQDRPATGSRAPHERIRRRAFGIASEQHGHILW